MIVTFGEAEQLASDAGIHIVKRPDRRPYVRAVVRAERGSVPARWKDAPVAYRVARLFSEIVLRYRRRAIAQRPGADPFQFGMELTILCARRLTGGDTQGFEHELRVRFQHFEHQTHGTMKPALVDELTEALVAYFV